MSDGLLDARVVSAVALLVLCVVARGASAQPAAGDDAQAKEVHRTALYAEGVGAATAGRWADAKERFAAVLAIRVSPKVLFSLAQTEEHLGQVASASADYGRALDGAKAAGTSDVVVAAEQARKAIAPRVPHVRVHVDGARAPAATLDGQPIAVNTDVAVDPGPHRVVVSAPGMREASAMVTISERQDLEVPIRLQAVGEPVVMEPIVSTPVSLPSAPKETVGPRAGPWRAIGVVVTAVGVVGLGVGTYFGIDAKSKNDQSNTSGCVGDNCTPAAAQIRRDALWSASASTAAFIVGGVVAATGIVVWLVAPSNDKARVGVTPVALGAGGGLVVRGGF